MLQPPHAQFSTKIRIICVILIVTGVSVLIPDDTFIHHESSSVYARQHPVFSLVDLIFMPDSISLTGFRGSMILSSNHLVNFWPHILEKYQFSASVTVKNSAISIVFPTHSRGLTLTDPFSTLRYKQDSKLDIQIIQHVVVSTFNGQNLTTICRFSTFPELLH